MAIPVSPAVADGNNVCTAGLVVAVIMGQCESVDNGPGTVIAQQQQQQAAGGGGGGGGSSSSSGSSSSGSGGSGAGGPNVGAEGPNATPRGASAREASAPPARTVAVRPAPAPNPTPQPLGEGDVEGAPPGEDLQAAPSSAPPTLAGHSADPAGGTPTDAVPASGQAPGTAASGPVVNSADPAGSAVLADGGLLRQTGLLPAAMLSIAGVVFFLSGRRAALSRQHKEETGMSAPDS